MIDFIKVGKNWIDWTELFRLRYMFGYQVIKKKDMCLDVGLQFLILSEKSI